MDVRIAGLYDLEQTIGQGHFAIVKRAKHVFTQEQVAVKIIDKDNLDIESREHMMQEVRCMKLVQHPNIVRLYEVIDTQTKLFLILELGDYDMHDFILKYEEKGCPEPLAQQYFSQIIKAISYCHKLHVVHRDLKPENVVFFEQLGMVKLTDFGFSNNYEPGTQLKTWMAHDGDEAERTVATRRPAAWRAALRVMDDALFVQSGLLFLHLYGGHGRNSLNRLQLLRRNLRPTMTAAMVEELWRQHQLATPQELQTAMANQLAINAEVAVPAVDEGAPGDVHRVPDPYRNPEDVNVLPVDGVDTEPREASPNGEELPPNDDDSSDSDSSDSDDDIGNKELGLRLLYWMYSAAKGGVPIFQYEWLLLLAVVNWFGEPDLRIANRAFEWGNTNREHLEDIFMDMWNDVPEADNAPNILN
ncbi:unnamed protein product, partial [Mesorhabditis spiculigera]